MRAIDGYAQVLPGKDAGSLSDDQRRDLELTRSSAARMGKLIDGLLAFSRTTRQAIQHKEVDIHALAGDVIREQG